MKNEALKRIFEFLEEKEQQNPPFLWKHISGEPLTERDLNIKDNLYLNLSIIRSLPEGLKVGGDLFLQRSSIESLPEGLVVGGSLSLLKSKITSLPKNLKVGGFLNLYNTKITSLPEGLEVGGDLYIHRTPLVKYSDKEIREMIKPGFIKGEIYR